MRLKCILLLFPILCCSFLCDKKWMQRGRVREIYLYPICGDTSSYVKQKYQPFHTAEYHYVNSRLVYRKIADKTTNWIVNTYSYPVGRRPLRTTDTFGESLPESWYPFNDTCGLSMQYYADGAISSCSWAYKREIECLHHGSYCDAMTFEPCYLGKMTGKTQVICDTNVVTDALTNDEFLKILHRARQAGVWKRYNADNYLTDSIGFDRASDN